MSRRPVLTALIVVALVLAVVVPAGVVWQRRAEAGAQRRAAIAFADAWRAGRLDRVRFAGADPAVVAADVQKVTAGLTPASRDVPASVRVLATEAGPQDTASARLHVTWTLTGNHTWSYDSSLPLVSRDGAWRPSWRPDAVHPSLQPGQVLKVTRTRTPRADILGGNGEPMVTEGPVVVVGMEPRRSKNLRRSADQIAQVVDIDAANLAQRAADARPTSFVDVITLRQRAYEDVKDRLRSIPGVVVRLERRALAPNAQFARALFGTVGPATAEIVERSRGRVRPGDVTGLSGLQLAYDERLTGTPGVTVTAVTPGETATTDEPNATAKPAPAVLFTEDPVPGRTVQLTLDRGVQEAAEGALTGATGPAALVAIRPSTGEVLAVANGGRGGAGYNRALLGRYPPGSTFKIVSTFALLQDGLRPDASVACPFSVTVGGKRFVNAEGAALGTVAFRRGFALSCNTVFVGSAGRITPAQLVAASKALGYGQPNLLGASAFTGSVPPARDSVGHAASVIGQGTVLASPLAVATGTAAIAAGRARPVQLVVEPAPETVPAEPAALPAGIVEDLQQLMRGVVTGGSGTALSAVNGGPVSGKTGTAEFGTANPPLTHAWFTGYQDDLAFAVVVERGGFGGRVAAPLAAEFLNRIAG